MINLHTKILLVIKHMRTQFKFTHRLICTPEYIYTPEFIYTRVFFAHANWTLDSIILFLEKPTCSSQIVKKLIALSHIHVSAAYRSRI